MKRSKYHVYLQEAMKLMNDKLFCVIMYYSIVYNVTWIISEYQSICIPTFSGYLVVLALTNSIQNLCFLCLKQMYVVDNTNVQT